VDLIFFVMLDSLFQRGEVANSYGYGTDDLPILVIGNGMAE